MDLQASPVSFVSLFVPTFHPTLVSSLTHVVCTNLVTAQCYNWGVTCYLTFYNYTMTRTDSF